MLPSIAVLVFGIVSGINSLIIFNEPPVKERMEIERICDDYMCICVNRVNGETIEGTIRSRKYELECDKIMELRSSYLMKTCDDTFCWCQDMITNHQLFGSRKLIRNFNIECATFPVGYCSFPNIRNGRSWSTSIVQEQVPSGEIISYMCNAGYRLMGVQQNLCLSNLEYADDHPHCVRIK